MSERFDGTVVFVHGLQGSGEQFDFLTELLPPTVKKNVLLLPGHGGTVKEFRRARLPQWQACVNDAVKNASREGGVIFVGHSMGCLLGLQAALKGGFVPEATLLLCCPFRIRPTLRYFKQNAALLGSGNNDDPFLAAARQANSVKAKHGAEYLTCAAPYIELLKLIKNTRRAQGRIHGAEFYFSERDEIVAPSSKTCALRFAGKESVHILPGSGHNYFTEAAKRMLRERLLFLVGERQRRL